MSRYDLEIIIELCRIFVPLMLPPAIIFAMLVITIVKTMRGDFRVVEFDKKTATKDLYQDSKRRSRPNVQHDGNRWLSAIRNAYRRIGVWAHKKCA